MNGHRTLIVTSPDDPQLTHGERQTYREYGYASEVCVPLVVDHELYGLIDIYDTRERDYTEYLSFLKSAGQTVARVLENALLVERVEQTSRDPPRDRGSGRRRFAEPRSPRGAGCARGAHSCHHRGRRL